MRVGPIFQPMYVYLAVLRLAKPKQAHRGRFRYLLPIDLACPAGAATKPVNGSLHPIYEDMIRFNGK